MDAAGDDKKQQQQPPQGDEGEDLRGAVNPNTNTKSIQSTPEQNPSQQGLSDETDMDVARRFLADDNVRNATRSQKVRFLRSKGLRDEQIEILLQESERRSRTKPDGEEDSSRPLEKTDSRVDRPPIVTYPEFLARPPQPPPLVTPNTLINTLYALTGISALVYGVSAWVVEPMVESLNESRQDLYATTSRNLDAIVSKLQGAVSEIPSAAKRRPDSKGGYTDDSVSEYDDPTELFHRDIGTQTPAQPPLTRGTSPFSGAPNTTTTPALAGTVPDEPVTHRHARQLARLAASVSSLRDDLVAQAEGFADCKASIDVFSDDLEKLAAQSTAGSPTSYFTGRTDFFYGSSELNKKPYDPDDEIKKVRDSIRRLKGTLLSARNFPISAASLQ